VKADAARAMGYSVLWIRLRATMVGGFLAGIGGRSCRCSIPAAGTRASRAARASPPVALVILRAGDSDAVPVGVAWLWRCCRARTGIAIGRRHSGYYLFKRPAPYILTLAIMIITCSPKRTLTARRRVVHHPIGENEPFKVEQAMPERYIKSEPYAWPYIWRFASGKHRHSSSSTSDRFCGVGGYVDKMDMTCR